MVGRRAVVVGVAIAYVTGFFCSLYLTVSNAAAAGTDLHPIDFSLAVGFVALPLAGALIEWHRPGNRTGRLLLGIGIGTVLAVLGSGWATYALRVHPGLPLGGAGAWLACWTMVAAFGLAPWLFATFPSGGIESRWLRALSRPAAVALVVAVVAQAFAPGPIDGVPAAFAPIGNPLGVERLRTPASVVTTVAVAMLVAFLVAAIADLVARFRRSTGETRLQLRWLALSTPVLPISMAVGMVLPERAGEVVFGVGQPVFLAGTAAGISVAILRHRLYDIDVVIRRSLVFAALTALVAGAYVAIVAAIGALVAGPVGPLPSLVAVGLVAVAFQPARTRLQRSVDRLVYGRRAEPYAVLSALGERIAAQAPDDALRTIIETVRRELRVAAVAIETAGVTYPGERFEIVYEGRRVATLVVATRGEPLTVPERRLLADVARQAGAAVRARELTAELQLSREQAVADREEDRRRVRRDLHDGLGPALAGMLLRADVAADFVASDPNRAAEELAVLKAQLVDATQDVRRLVHGLRPPALDELGLVPAIHAQAASLMPAGRGGPVVEIDAPETAPALPAAVEVAVLRVAGEAMTNVVRHAAARHCRVALAFDGGVSLDVEDDGVGIPAHHPVGVGLSSMAERAAELGGSLAVSGTGQGTRVHLSLPVPR